MLDDPDSRKIVNAIRTYSGVGRAVLRSAGIVVDHRLVVEVDHVECAVRADPRIDRPEPEIATAHEFGFLPAFFLFHGVGHAIRSNKLMVDEVERGLAG